MKDPRRSVGRSEARKLALMRQSDTKSSTRHSIGGREKQPHYSPRPVTLPKTPWDGERTQDGRAKKD